MVDTATLKIKVTREGIKEAAKELGLLDDASEEVEASSVSMAKGMAGAAKATLAVGTAALTAAAGFTAMVVAAGANVREMENMARLAGMNVEEFKALAFATKQFGIDADKLADISKDVTEKLGEFATVGTGAFADFQEVMGYTKNEAQAIAKELSKLSGVDALTEITRQMELAGVETAGMSFVLESLGSDLTTLLPALQNNGAALKGLTSDFKGVTSQMELTKKQSEDLKKVTEQFDLLLASMTAATNYLLSEFAPEIQSAMSWVTKNVPQATALLAEFFDSFRDNGNQKNVVNISKQIEATAYQIRVLQKDIKAFEAGPEREPATTRVGKRLEKKLATILANMKTNLKNQTAKLAVLQDRQEKALGVNQKKAKPAALDGVKAAKGGVSTEVAAAVDSELKLRRDASITKRKIEREGAAEELQILQFKYAMHAEQTDTFYDKELKKYQEWNERKLISDTDYAKAVTQINALKGAEQKAKSDETALAKKVAADQKRAELEAKLEEDRYQKAQEAAQKDLDLLQFSLESEDAQINAYYDLELEKYAKHREEKLITAAQYDEAEVALTQKREDELTNLRNQRQSDQLQQYSTFFDGMSGVMEAWQGKQSKAYRIAYGVSKAFALADAALKVQQSIAASASVGFPANIVTIAAATAQAATIIASMKSQSYSGRLQGGDVNANQPYMVGERGPEIMMPSRSGKVVNINNIRNEESGSRSAQPPVVNVQNMIGTDLFDQWGSSDAGQATIMNAINTNRNQAQAIMKQ